MRHEAANPGPLRLWCVADAFRSGMSVEELYQVSKIDPWFLAQIEDLIWEETNLSEIALSDLDHDSMRRLKRKGFSDKRLAVLLDVSEKELRERRMRLGIRPVYKRVDTCAGEFATPTAYLYSTYEEECEANPSNRDKIMVLGGGPNRIGQGIEFDYCCVHAVSQCVRTVTKQSWLIVIRRQYPLIMIPLIGCFLSRLHSRMFWQS